MALPDYVSQLLSGPQRAAMPLTGDLVPAGYGAVAYDQEMQNSRDMQLMMEYLNSLQNPSQYAGGYTGETTNPNGIAFGVPGTRTQRMGTAPGGLEVYPAGTFTGTIGKKKVPVPPLMNRETGGARQIPVKAQTYWPGPVKREVNPGRQLQASPYSRIYQAGSAIPGAGVGHVLPNRPWLWGGRR